MGLTVFEPFASLFSLGEKRIETRVYGTHYRGPLVICSSRTRDPNSLGALSSKPLQAALAPLNPGGDLFDEITAGDLRFGEILALLDLTRCVPVERLGEEEMERESRFGNFSAGRNAWVMENLRLPRERLPSAGAPGLFAIEVPDQLFYSPAE